MTRRGVVGNVLLAFASMAVVLGGLELGLRIASRGVAGKEAGTLAQYTMHDPVLGWKKRPGGSAHFARREYSVDVKINSLGLRDPERGYEAAAGTFRILALGDSFVEAYSVSLDDTVTQVLERQLAPSCRAEVINGGTAAYSTDQEYLFYKTEGVRYGARVVALFFYYNDVFFNWSEHHFGTPKPQLVERDGALVLAEPVGTPAPPPPSAAAAASVSPSAALAAANVASEGTRGSALVAFARDRLRKGAPRAYQVLAHLGLWEPIVPAIPHPQLKVYKRKNVPEIVEAWTLTRRILLELAREVAAHDARLVVVYVPSRMEVNDADWDATRMTYGMEPPLWDRGAVLEEVQKAARAAGVPLLDLTGPMRRADSLLGAKPYYTFDGHWTPLGHRIAAEQLERFLRSQGLLDACRR
jgi:hypothetical protein